MLFYKDFSTWLLIGWHYNLKPIRSHARNLNNMNFNMRFSQYFTFFGDLKIDARTFLVDLTDETGSLWQGIIVYLPITVLSFCIATDTCHMDWTGSLHLHHHVAYIFHIWIFHMASPVSKMSEQLLQDILVEMTSEYKWGTSFQKSSYTCNHRLGSYFESSKSLVTQLHSRQFTFWEFISPIVDTFLPSREVIQEFTCEPIQAFIIRGGISPLIFIPCPGSLTEITSVQTIKEFIHNSYEFHCFLKNK